MMRATPYWSVSPMAISAYMPPSIRPARMALVISLACLLLCRPGRLRHDGSARAVIAGRRNAVELAVLPLTDPPVTRRHVVLELDLADHGIERAALQVLDDGGAVDLAHALDRLLQHLQAG